MHTAWRLLAYVILTAALASHAGGADVKPASVTVQCTQPQLVAGLVRLRACLAGEVEVLFRHAHFGL